MPATLQRHRLLLLLLVSIWLIAILDIQVTLGFSLFSHGVNVGLREGQHQSKPKSNQEKTSLHRAYFGHLNSDLSIKEMTKDIVSLESVRQSLMRQEETLIFALIERAAFRYNEYSYREKNSMLVPDPQCIIPSTKPRKGTFFEMYLCEAEKLFARIRRYQSPEEYPFFPEYLPAPVLPELAYPQILIPTSINENSLVLEKYINEVLPSICRPGDDEQYGSCVQHDVSAVQALSRRIHFGLFVGESKYQENPAKYMELCKARDVDAVYNLLTDVEVEKMVLDRAFFKASTYCKDLTFSSDGENSAPIYKIEPEAIRSLYANIVIPMTKKTQTKAGKTQNSTEGRVSSAFTTTATSTKPVNNSTIMIRLAVRSDTSRIARINIANLPENYPPDFYRHHLSRWPQHALVAEECYSLPEGGRGGGITRRKLVGYALGRVYEEPGDVVKVRNRMQLMGIHQPSTICHITSLADVPEQRRSGVAQSLMFQLHQQMRRCHRNCYVNLHVRQSNTAAIRLYMEHMGYKIVDYIPNYYEDGEDAYLMGIVLREPCAVLAEQLEL